jgi:hypothetical protein
MVFPVGLRTGLVSALGKQAKSKDQHLGEQGISHQVVGQNTASLAKVVSNTWGEDLVPFRDRDINCVHRESHRRFVWR